MLEERRVTCSYGLGSDLEAPVLPVLDEVVVFEVLDEEPHVEPNVGDCRLDSLDPLSENPRSVENYCFRRLRDRRLES